MFGTQSRRVNEDEGLHNLLPELFPGKWKKNATIISIKYNPVNGLIKDVQEWDGGKGCAKNPSTEEVY